MRKNIDIYINSNYLFTNLTIIYTILFEGYYTFGGVAYKASPLPNGSSLRKCKAIVWKTLKLNAPCKYHTCTFNGVWNGGGLDAIKNIYISSFFFDMASEVI